MIINQVYTAIIKQDDDWRIGWIEETSGVNCQQEKREELIESLKTAFQQ